MIHVCELAVVRLRHPFDLETEYLQFVHHFGNGSRIHAEIFAAEQHLCAIDKWREMFEGLRFPEIVVTMVEEVPVKLVECGAFTIGEFAVDKGAECRDTRMKLLRLFRIAKEQHLIGNGKESRFDSL